MTPNADVPTSSRIARHIAMIAVCMVMFLTFMDMTIVSVAIGSVQSHLHAGVSQLQWVVNGYGLTFASFMLLGGTLGDRLGRKKIMLGGLLLFAAGSLLGALAPNPDVLIGGRVIMGIGAAASEPGSLSIIRHMFPDRRVRARAIGTWAAVSGLALAFGPVIGGVLVALASWRGVFWFNVAAALLIVVLAVRTVPESSSPQTARLDIPGFIAGTMGLGALTFAVILGETDGFHSPLVIGLFLIGVVALIGFVHIERASTSPLLDLAYFKSSRFTGAMIVAFILYFSIFSIFFFTALYLTAVIGYAPARIALEFLPMTAAMVVAAVFAGRRVARLGPRVPMAEGCVMAGAGVLLSALLLLASPPSLWLMATLALAGYGFGATVVPMTSVALSEVPAERSGMAASATNTSRELGAVFGVAVLGALVNAHLTGDLTHRLKVLKIPTNFISIIINAVETGTVPSGVNNGGSIEDHVIRAADGAFRSGLEQSLVVSGLGMLIAAGIAVRTLSPSNESSETTAFDL